MSKVFFLIFATALMLLLPVSIFAATTGTGVDPQSAIGSVTPPGNVDRSSNAVNNYVSTGFNLILFLGLIATLGYLVYGGIKWIMAGGDAKQLQGARDTLMHAVLGLILLSTGFAITAIFKTFITATPIVRVGPNVPDHTLFVGQYCGGNSALCVSNTCGNVIDPNGSGPQDQLYDVCCSGSDPVYRCI